MLRRVVVTGLGLVTPLAVGVELSWQRLLKSESGVSKLRGAAEIQAIATGVPCRIAAYAPWFPSTTKKFPRYVDMAILAAREAVTASGWKPLNDNHLERAGVYMGTGIGNLSELYDTSLEFQHSGYRRVSPHFVPRLLINTAASEISIIYGLKGPNHAVSTACTTGAHALGDAARIIKTGEADVMLAGAAESCVHAVALAGFARMRSLATAWNDNPSAASRPFDCDRAGFVMGEGAGVMVLEEYHHACARNAPILAELVGYGLAADAYHLTAPCHDGRGAYMAMRRALQQAGVKPCNVDYINAHATSTVLGDAAENRAIRSLLLNDTHPHVKPSHINVSSTKGAIGHLLGASGIVEAIFTVLAIRDRILPPTLNLWNPGPPTHEFDCNYVPRCAQTVKKLDIALSNSFGFGGSNASICFRKICR